MNKEPKTNKNSHMKYKFTTKMREISGFGGGYEEACRAMVVAGLEHLDKKALADPRFSEYENIYGVIKANNKDAEELEGAMLKAVEDCTGAMMQASVTHVLYIKKHGWKKYKAEMEKKKDE